MSPVSRSGRHRYRFRLFPLGLITGMFNIEALVDLIREATHGGFELVRREFSIEKRRVALILSGVGFGLLFRKGPVAVPDYEYDVAVYKTRLATRTADPNAMAKVLNDAATRGFELYFAIKFPTRFLFFIPRESYVFLFRRRQGQSANVRYVVSQTPYRLLTRTLDEEQYEQELNAQAEAGPLKVTFRDEKRVLGGLIRRPTVLAIFEHPVR